VNHDRPGSFGNRIRGLRRALGLTQEQLAERAGISVRTLISLESEAAGNVRPSTLRSIGAALELEGADLEAFGARVTPRRSRWPAETSAFIGREAEVADILHLLDLPARAVTIVGPPGVGKSRVAATVARSAEDGYADGAWFVSLAHATDEEQAALAIADTLDLRLSGFGPPIATLARALGSRSLLLVLDNVDLLRNAAGTVSTLLRDAPHVRAIATSRNLGAMPFAHEYLIAPLPPPRPCDFHDLERVASSPAVQLFVARARSVDPQFELDATNVVAVAQCAAQLDGLPLAIELAAPYLRIHTPAELSDRLTRSMAIVIDRSDPSAASPRTLRQALAMSYDMLDDASRKLLGVASVFRAGCTAEALAAVGEGSLAEIEFALLNLLEANLARLDEARRVRVLYVVREFALSEMERASLERVRERHARYYLELILQSGQEPNSQAERHLTYEREMANLDAAFESALELGDASLALRLALATYPFARASRIRHGLAQTERALVAAQRDATVPPDLVARATYVAAFFRYEVTEYDRAMGHARKAKALFDAIGDAVQSNVLDHFIGALHISLGRAEHAREVIDRSVERFLALGDESRYAESLLNLCGSLEIDDRFEESISAASRALEIFGRLENDVGRATAFYVLGRIEATRGNLDAAREHLDRCLSMRRSLGSAMAIAQVLVLFALLEVLAENAEAARSLLAEAVALNRNVQDGHVDAKLALAAAAYAFRWGDLRRAGAMRAYYAIHHSHTCVEPIWRRERAALEAALAHDPWDARALATIEPLVESAIAR
jgi:predicted ATPase/DNA-binding XRE family transcriptional regulator